MFQDPRTAHVPLKLKETIIENSHQALHDSGKFIQFQYSLNSKKMFKSIFNHVSITFTLLNFPPAFVYTCEKK